MPETEIQPASQTGLVNASESLHGFDASDIDIPRLNIVQKTSDIDSETGTLVLDKTHELVAPDTQALCIVLSATKKWREDVPFDDDVMPKIANNMAECAELKESSSYPVIEWADITLLFPQPEDGDNPEAFPFPIGEKSYAMGRINVAKDAYRKTFKALTTFATFNKTIPITSRMWTFESQLLSRGKYSWYVPTLAVSSEEVPADAAEFISSLGL